MEVEDDPKFTLGYFKPDEHDINLETVLELMSLVIKQGRSLSAKIR